MSYVSTDNVRTVDHVRVSSGFVSLNPDDENLRTIIPLTAIAWWEERIEEGAIDLWLVTGAQLQVRFFGEDSPGAWSELAEGLWFALRVDADPAA
jgi:hypothetical protein